MATNPLYYTRLHSDQVMLSCPSMTRERYMQGYDRANSLVNTMTNEYIDGARMKGVTEINVIIRHGLRNSLSPVVTRIGMQIGTIIGGSTVVENVFSWPGMGMLLVSAAKNRDFQVVQLGVLIISTTVTIAHILIDLSHGWLDPRVREQVK